MTEKSASDVLREKLTERGVKWWPMRNNGYYEDRDTEFVVNGKKHTAHEWGDGIAVYSLTPEQAIAATLGSERELIDLAHNAWSMALCAMQGMPIPAEWGDAVERGLRKYGISVDEELAGFEVIDE